LAQIVSGRDCQDAWRAATGLILRDGPISNLIVEIADPTARDARWASNDPRRQFPEAKSLREVAETIWPRKLEREVRTRGELYERYLRVHERAKRMHRRTRSRWGTC